MGRRTSRGGAARRARQPGAEPLEPRLLFAAELVADLNRALAYTGSISEFMDGGDGAAYVSINRPDGGGQLWRVDGTQAGTGPVADLPTSPWLLGSAGGTFYFTTQGIEFGRELWKSDGTPAGTLLLKEIYPGSRDSTPAWIGRQGSRMLFSAEDPEHGRELWVTDGTAEGTSLLVDVLPGAGHGAGGFAGPPLPDGSLRFWGNDGVHRGLFRTDGTAAGTVPFVDLNAVPGIGWIQRVAAAGWRIAFASDSQVYVTDGTPAGVIARADASKDPLLGPVEAGGAFYYARKSGPSAGLYRIDPGSTVPVPVVEAGSDAPFTSINELASAGGTLWFTSTRAATGTEVYRVGPGEGRAQFLGDLTVPGPSTSSKPQHFVASGGRVYFLVGTGWWSGRLWASDAAGTGIAPLDRPEGGELRATMHAPFGEGGLVFSSLTPGVGTTEFWTSDGTPAGTRRTYVAPVVGSGSSLPAFLGTVGGRLLFTADDGSDRHLYATDGTAAGTAALSAGTGLRGSALTSITPIGGKAYFEGRDSAWQEPWVTDGTAGGTFRLRDLNPTTYASSVSRFAELAGDAYFFTDDHVLGRELWRTDGTSAGTRRVIDLLPGSGSGVLVGPDGPVAFGGALYFAGTDGGSAGIELWRSDGTAAGTSLVADLWPGPASSSPSRITPVGDRLFFLTATEAGHGAELWVSDGTAAGTRLVTDVLPGAVHTYKTALLAHDGLFYFSVTGTDGQPVLWRSDGTPEGTLRLADLAVSRITLLHGRPYFLALNGPSDPLNPPGSSLWTTDGTPAGTVRVRHLYPDDGGYNWYPVWEHTLVNANGRLFFAGHETLWTSDGTAAGTRPAGELVPGGVPSARGETLGVLDGAIYFAGDAGADGVELFRLGDCFAPAVLEAAGDAGGPAVRFRFGEDVGASVGPADLLLTNVTTGQVLAADSLAVAYDATTHTATFSPAGGTWPDGRYRAVLRAAGVADAAGNALAADATAELTLLSGGGDSDGRVDAADYYRIDRGRALGLAGWDNGDFDGDGTGGDADDYLLLDSAFLGQTASGEPAAGEAAAAAASPRPPSPFVVAGGPIAPAPADEALDDDPWLLDRDPGVLD